MQCAGARRGRRPCDTHDGGGVRNVAAQSDVGKEAAMRVPTPKRRTKRLNMASSAAVPNIRHCRGVAHGAAIAGEQRELHRIYLHLR
jgi:hypothetical protein